MIITAIAVAALVHFTAKDADTTDAKAEWQQLFNGKDLEGWYENRFKHAPEWKIVDGVLVGHGGQGYLSSVEDYDNFELVVEARISDTGGGRGNSGVYFRCASHTDKTQEFPIGYEAQLDHGDGNNPTGSIHNLGSEGAKAPRFADLKDDEWVTMRIRVVGDHVQTWVNDKPAADCKLPEKDRLMTGSVLLQMHHKTGKVEFRKVEIRKLKVR